MDPAVVVPEPKKAPKGTLIGENLWFADEGEFGVIRFRKDYRGGKSASGKTVRVFSTEGNKTAPGLPIKMGLNGYVIPA